jgi:hypothetical protein
LLFTQIFLELLQEAVLIMILDDMSHFSPDFFDREFLFSVFREERADLKAEIVEFELFLVALDQCFDLRFLFPISLFFLF